MRLHALPLLLAACLVPCGLTAQQAPKAVHGVQPAFMDTSVKPCDDFYRYANGTWLKQNPVPADKSRWGGFEELADRNRDVLKQILDDVSKRSDWPKGSVQQKVADFYASGMDEAAIEKLGTKPLEPLFKRIGTLKDPKGLAALLAELRLEGHGAGFGFSVGQDKKDSTRYMGNLSQGGLGLPDRDYYLKDDEKSRQLREKYAAHVARMLELAGEKPGQAKRDAGSVMALETRLAKASNTRVENRDPVKTYNKTTLAELQAQAPGFDWKAFFGKLGVKDVGDLNVRQPAFFKEFGAVASGLPAAEWRAYLRWHAVSGMASVLPKAFGDENFDFHGRILNGIPKQEERWKRIQGATDRALGEALGQLYVEKAFSGGAKQKMLVIVENLRAALKERIEKLDWMSPDTKAQALKKLAAFGVKVGYPDKWKDYSSLEISRASYAANVRRARIFEVRDNLGRLGKPIDRTEWGMTPPTVNAYYSPTMNEIVFPAGILQPPFFDPDADDACNYGGIGAVIGHEMTHGFDDSGSQYDAAGNLKNWWTDADRAAYKARTDLVVKQFDGYQALPDQAVNGRMTLGENIADLGGLKIAYAAWQRSLQGRPAPQPIDGLTPEQRFFLNYAAVWRNNIRDEALRVRLNTDVHSPGRFRVLGPLSNLPEFFQAFGCGEASPMMRPEAERPAIW